MAHWKWGGGRISRTIFAIWSVCLKFWHRKIVKKYYMWNIFCWEFISIWKQRILSALCTDLPFEATLSHWHYAREKTYQILILLNTVHGIASGSTVADVATTVMEECQRPWSGDWQTAASALRKKMSKSISFLLSPLALDLVRTTAAFASAETLPAMTNLGKKLRLCVVYVTARFFRSCCCCLVQLRSISATGVLHLSVFGLNGLFRALHTYVAIPGVQTSRGCLQWIHMWRKSASDNSAPYRRRIWCGYCPMSKMWSEFVSLEIRVGLIRWEDLHIRDAWRQNPVPERPWRGLGLQRWHWGAW